MFLNNITMKPKLTALFLLVGIIPLALVGWWSSRVATKALMEKSYAQLENVRELKKAQIERFFNERKGDIQVLNEMIATLRRETFSKLTAVQQMKKQQLESYLNERYGDVTMLAANETLAKALREFQQAFENEGRNTNGPQWQALSATHTPWLQKYKDQFGYDDVLLISQDGYVIYSLLQEADLGQDVKGGALKDSPLGKCFKAALNAPAFQDFEPYSPSGNRPVAFVGAPIKQAEQTLGIVAFQLPLTRISQLMQDRTGMGKTGETYLVGPDKLMRSDSFLDPVNRSVNASFARPETGRVDTEASQQALSGKTGTRIIRDYNGNYVLSAFAPLNVNGLHWAIIAEMDVEEAFSPKDEKGNEFYAKYKELYGYYDLFLCYPDGFCFYTVSKEADYRTNMLNGKYADSNLGQLFAQVIERKQFGFADFKPYAPSNNEPSAFIAYPIIIDTSVEIVVALQLSIESINAIMQEREGMGKTGETYLVGADNLMRSDSFLEAQTHSVLASFANPERGNVKTEAAKEALSGKTGANVIKDYTDSWVLSAYTPVKAWDTTWALLAEIDRDEVNEPVNGLIRSILLTGLIIAVVVAGIALMVALSIANPLVQGVTFARAVAAGNLNAELSITQQDEIGILAGALRDMKKTIGAVLNEMQRLVEAIQEGKLETRGNASQFEGGWRELVNGVNNVINAFMAPFNVAAEYVDRIAKGNIPEPITDVYHGDFNELKNNLNQCISAVTGLVAEVNMLTTAATEGKLEVRGNPDKFEGDFARIVQGINNTLDAVIQPLNVAAEYIDRVSKGELPDVITEAYKGDFNEIKNNLNGLINGLHGLAQAAQAIAQGDMSVQIQKRSEADVVAESFQTMSITIRQVIQEMNRLVNAAVDGQLDTRGDINRFQGDFGRIIQGVNSTLDAVITPLNVAAEYVDRIAQGDIPAKITETYKGDFNEIKNNLNLLIDAMQEITALAEDLARGNLAVEVQERSEQDTLMQALNAMLNKLNQVVLDVKTAADNVATSSQSMSSGAEEMSQGATEQAAAAEEASSSMEQMAANIRQNAENALQTEKIAIKAAEDARENGRAVGDALKAMHEITQKIMIVEDITRQTRMLSLNATIEAAKAQEHGKGFAVVAAEVRALAERSQAAANEINGLANSSMNIAERATEMLKKLVPDIQRTAELVQEISAASKEQTTGAEQINRAIQQLDNVIQQNSATSEEMASTAEELAAQAEMLQNTMAFFTIRAQNQPKLEATAQHFQLKHVGKVRNAPKPQPDRRKPAAKSETVRESTTADAGVNLVSEESLGDERDADFEKF